MQFCIVFFSLLNDLPVVITVNGTLQKYIVATCYDLHIIFHLHTIFPM